MVKDCTEKCHVYLACEKHTPAVRRGVLCERLLREFAESCPIVPADDRNGAYCFHCAGSVSWRYRLLHWSEQRAKHGPKCPWKAARKALGIKS